MRTPDFSGITNLEVLVLNNCTSLVKVHNSVVHLNKLVTLDLADCKNLTKIPSGIYKLKSVKLSGCTKLGMVPRFEFASPSTLRYSLRISSGIPLECFGFKISKLLHLKGLMDCASLVENHEAITYVDNLHNSVLHLDKLVTLDLADCKNFIGIPKLSGLVIVETLFFTNCTSLVEVHKSVLHLDKVVTLWLADYKNLTKIRYDINLSGFTKFDMVLRFEFPSPSTLRYAFRMSSGIPLESFGFKISKLLQLCLTDCASLVKNHGAITCVDIHKIHEAITYVDIPKIHEAITYLDDLATRYSDLENLVIFNFHNHLTILDVSLSRRFSSLDELPICLQALDANNATSLEWILTGSNLKLSEQLIISIGCSKLLKEDHTSNPRKKLLKELIARDRFSVFLPGAEFPDWFDYKSTGSILSFVVTPLVKQKIRGWFLCAVFSSRFHDIYGFTVICKFKNNTKGTELLYRQKNCHVIPCQEHLWLHSVPLHHVAHLLEAGDEVEYSIHVNGSFQPKKFGFNLIYENDKKDYQSYFEAMIQNASPPYKNDFLHEDVSTDQAMAGDHKIHPPYVQDQPSEGNRQRGWPYLHENPQGAMFFEGRAPFEQNLYLPGIPTMNSMSQTERLRSLEAERQLLHHQLENERRAHLATRENAAWASWQHRDQIAALESQLRIALAHGSQFAPQLYMDLPRPHFESESASSSQFATASSSSAPTQATISGLTPMASMRHSTLGLDYAAFLDSPALGIQSFNDPSRSTQSNRGSDLSQ
uniref:C-JID domain-containing protein n=1 Tax=Fagus sylvatica TaxID=28930 RepID=A0A2N9GST1_FAGSY